MAHLTGTLHTQRAQVGDTFTSINGLDYQAVLMDKSGENVCDGCEFNPKNCTGATPDCVSYDVIFIRAPQN